MTLTSYFGQDGVTVTASTSDELYEAFDHIHTLALEIDENMHTEISEGMLRIISEALDKISGLYIELDIDDPLL